MNSKVLLVVAAVLILVGVLKPDLSSIINNSTRDRVDVVNVVKPTNKGLLDACFDVIKS
jgi:hypothetical protein